MVYTARLIAYLVVSTLVLAACQKAAPTGAPAGVPQIEASGPGTFEGG